MIVRQVLERKTKPLQGSLARSSVWSARSRWGLTGGGAKIAEAVGGASQRR